MFDMVIYAFWEFFLSIVLQAFHGQVKQGGVTTVPQPPAPRPKVRARRGQATDPHSIAERVMFGCLVPFLQFPNFSASTCLLY